MAIERQENASATAKKATPLVDATNNTAEIADGQLRIKMSHSAIATSQKAGLPPETTNGANHLALGPDVNFIVIKGLVEASRRNECRGGADSK